MKELFLQVFADLSPIIDYLTSNLLLLGIIIAYVIITFSFILVLFYGRLTSGAWGYSKIKAVFWLFAMLVFVSPLLFLFSWLFAAVLLLIASLLSGYSLVYPSPKKSRAHTIADLVLFFIALFLTVILWITLTPQQDVFAPIALSESLVPLATWIKRITVFWGVIEAARGFVYSFMKRGHIPAKSGTFLFAALFTLSTFTQDITGQNVLALIAEELPDYAFITGAVLAVLAFIKHRIAR